MEALAELVLELTDWCPLRCMHCSSCSGPDRHENLSLQEALDLIEQASRLGASQISFGGGEPTGSANFIQAIRRVSELGMHAEVFTNGTSSANHRLSPLSTELIGELSGIPQVTAVCSIHGSCESIHDEITQTPGSFSCFGQSLERLVNAGVVTALNFVPVRLNVDDFPEVVAFAEERGIRRLNVLRFVPQGRGHENRNDLELNREEEDEFVQNLLALRDRTSVAIRTGSPFNGIVPGNRVPCRAGSAKLVVQANGNVLPCEVFKHAHRKSWGLNIRQQSLADILDSPQLRELSDALSKDSCLECPVHSKLRSTNSIGVQHVLS